MLDDFTHVLLQQEKCDLWYNDVQKEFLQDLVTSFSVFVLLQSGVFRLNSHCGSRFMS